MLNQQDHWLPHYSEMLAPLSTNSGKYLIGTVNNIIIRVQKPTVHNNCHVSI